MNINLSNDFSNLVTKIFHELKLTDSKSTDILSNMFNKFSDANKYKIIFNEPLRAKLHELGIMNQAVTSNIPNDIINNKWVIIQGKMAKLIVLLLVKRIETGDCDAVVSTLIDAFDANIKSINTLIENTLIPTSLPSTTNKVKKKSDFNNSYRDYTTSSLLKEAAKTKYLKYKMKYLNLKNKILNNNI